MPRAAAKHPWSVPLALSDVPEAGRHLDLVADEAVRASIAELANLRDVSRLEAAFDVALRGHGGLHVTGQVQATVGQTCGVTLEPIDNEINETVDLVFMPEDSLDGGAAADSAADEAPEPLVGGIVDLGAIATEFLLLGIDPYPRKAGAVFQAPQIGTEAAHPFAVLATLKKRQGGQEG
jgi:uncharacterized metal-binding protein YceD (DUF177 family)